MTLFLKKLSKYLPWLGHWWGLAKNRQIKWFISLFGIIIVLILVIRLFEIKVNDSFDSVVDNVYWAIVTIMTVGYGDITPRTAAGRILTVLLIVAGVIMVSLMTATIASVLTATRIREGMGLKKIELDGHIVICGYNVNLERVIKSIISASPASPPEIVLVNLHDEAEINALIEQFPEATIRFVYGDYTHETTLNRASITKASSAIILADPGQEKLARPDDRTLLTVLAIKSISQDVRVCVELLDNASEVHIKRAGVDQIIVSGEFSGFLLASSVMSPGIPQALKELMYVDVGSNICREKIPSDIVGKTFREAAFAFFDRLGLLLVGVITEKKSFNLETVLTGNKDAIDDFIRRKFEEAGRTLEVESKGIVSVNINPGKDYIISEYDSAVVITSKG